MTKPGEDGVAELFRRAIEKRNRAIGKQRIGDPNNLFTWRYRGNRESYVFPDDDAGLEDLKNSSASLCAEQSPRNAKDYQAARAVDQRGSSR